MKRFMASSGAGAALALALASTSLAQDPIRTNWELGLNGTYHGYADKVGVNAGWGAGVLVGYHFLPNWAVESELEMVNSHRWSSGEKTNELPAHVRLAYHLPIGARHQFLVGAGFSRFAFSPTAAGDRTSNQYGGMLGWQMALTRLFAFRIQGAWDRFSPTQTSASNEKGSIYGFDFGLSWPGNAPERDSDGDGILNDMDACPNTALGDVVDARGCPLPKDRDHDGVNDANDACPNTPLGEAVDARGCTLPKDADRDGVIDTNDRCPNTPAGTKVDPTGCPLPPPDADKDGVIDASDRCPNTPAGTKVDVNGCPLPPPDTDHDGVIDTNDRCPNTPASTKVDARGCPMLFETGKTALVLQGVTFATGSATLTETSLPVLDRVAESLVGNPEVRLEVQGHTDNTGSLAGNRRISQARAESVRTYLVSKGVDATRLTAKGYGPDQPKVPNTSADNRAQNRRVELKQLP